MAYRSLLGSPESGVIMASGDGRAACRPARPTPTRSRRQRPRSRGFHEAEVQNLGDIKLAAPFGEDDACRFDVTMHEPTLVLGQRNAVNLIEDGHDPTRRLRAILADQFFEVDPVEVFHCVVEDAVGRPAIVVNGHGIRVTGAVICTRARTAPGSLDRHDREATA